MNYIYLTVLAFIMLLPGGLQSKEKTTSYPYTTFTISASMKEDAYAVLRDYSIEFELVNYGKAVERVHKVITILDEKGKDFGNLIIPYDKSQKVSSITGKSYNQLGITNDKLKSSAIQDLNYTSAGAIYDDLRVKVADFSNDTYPYTVEYSYEIEYNGLLGYPEWSPLDNFRISIEKSNFRFIYTKGLEVRFKEFNLSDSAKKESTIDNKKMIDWGIDSLKAWKEEPYAPPLSNFIPKVIAAPSNFIYEGSTGKMNTWEELGKWNNSLNEGRDKLPDNRKSEIQSMVKGIKDSIKIVNTLYCYMQSRTRYVGIQLGLGGWQPFPAETVDRLGYGDCKALSNYMKAILNCVGIRSFYTVAGSGTNYGITMQDFPSMGQNNHVILCVPLKSDTIWLECTSQKIPMGYLGASTSGKRVLLITPNGGKIVRTPLLTSEANRQTRSALVSIDPDGIVNAEVTTKYTGYQYDNVSPILDESFKEQEKAIYDDLGVTGATIINFAYDVKKGKIPEAQERITLTSDKYTTKTGTRMFVPLNMFNQRRSIPSKVEIRKMPIRQTYAYFDKDSIIYQLPKGYTLETLPKSKTFTTRFGEFKSSIRTDSGKVTYIREIKIFKGDYPKETYPELVEFYSNIVSNDKAKAVLKENPL
jgi:hypothetical protein